MKFFSFYDSIFDCIFNRLKTFIYHAVGMKCIATPIVQYVMLQRCIAAPIKFVELNTKKVLHSSNVCVISFQSRSFEFALYYHIIFTHNHRGSVWRRAFISIYAIQNKLSVVFVIIHHHFVSLSPRSLIWWENYSCLVSIIQKKKRIDWKNASFLFFCQLISNKLWMFIAISSIVDFIDH